LFRASERDFMNRCRLSAAAADGVVIVEVLFRPFDEFPPLFILLVPRGPPPYDFNPPLVTSTLLYLSCNLEPRRSQIRPRKVCAVRLLCFGEVKGAKIFCRHTTTLKN
jgi:hypothetical protein